MTIIEMKVHMDCAGCETKIKKALQKLDGVDDVDIDMHMQKVTVIGWSDQKKVLQTVRKTGRRAELWPYPYNPEYHNFVNQYYNKHDQREHQHNEPVSYFKSPTVSYSYNYYKHGYESLDYGYYQPPLSSALIDERTSNMFSDGNTNACSIM